MRSLDYSDIIVTDLQSIPKRKKDLDTIADPALYHLRERQLADLERLLDQLEPTDRKIIESVVVENQKDFLVARGLDLTASEVRRMKGSALNRLCRLRYGAAYQI